MDCLPTHFGLGLDKSVHEWQGSPPVLESPCGSHRRRVFALRKVYNSSEPFAIGSTKAKRIVRGSAMHAITINIFPKVLVVALWNYGISARCEMAKWKAAGKA
ncbi:unnamed protein product [Phytomonas sp. Hart1]|nr:unnamed protein product [Phytomonas sp. Hart1]|eukprot:CCW69817.1 unnamed protein product [Phytomonas sp. isolate Hart1]